MPRIHRLKPIQVTHEEVLHAFISPPLPEKGGLPTIVVTPAEPVSASDFQVHFYSPKAGRTSFMTRIRTGIQGMFATPAKQQTSTEAETAVVTEKSPAAPWRPVRVGEHGREYSPVPATAEFVEEDQGAIRLSEDSEEEFATGSLPQFTLSPSSSQVLAVSTRRRSRTALILAIPMLMVALHIISSQLGFGYESLYSSFGQDSDTS